MNGELETKQLVVQEACSTRNVTPFAALCCHFQLVSSSPACVSPCAHPMNSEHLSESFPPDWVAWPPPLPYQPASLLGMMCPGSSGTCCIAAGSSLMVTEGDRSQPRLLGSPKLSSAARGRLQFRMEIPEAVPRSCEQPSHPVSLISSDPPLSSS